MSEIETVRKLVANAIDLEHAGDEASESAAEEQIEMIGRTSTDIAVLAEVARYFASQNASGGLHDLTSQYACERSVARLLAALEAVSPATRTPRVGLQITAAVAADTAEHTAA